VPAYAAFLRAINLGSRNKISMPDLRQLFEDLGAEDVRTHVQSGNVAFRHKERSPATLVTAIQERISSELGHDIKVLLRTKAELAKVVGGTPFAKQSDPTKVHVTFLVDRPDPERVAGIDPSKYEPDEFEVIGREVHLHCPNGYGRSKLSNAFLEKKLAQAGTTRNWKTVTTMAEMTGS
jgi:uncharacterized protein (DUF1697 family)